MGANKASAGQERIQMTGAGIETQPLILLAQQMASGTMKREAIDKIKTREDALYLLELIASVAQSNPLLQIINEAGKMPENLEIHYSVLDDEEQPTT